MTHVRKFFSGSVALVLISGVSAGCAGNGLKGMFSRNETSGYKTLEELEAERVAKEASPAEGGRRFASWLPFGKSDAEPAEEVASSSADVAEDEKQVSSLWRNPFRRQETVESDPFLSKESPEEKIVADKPDTDRLKAVASGGKEAEEVSGDTAKDGSEERPIKAVGHIATADKPKQDDELVDRFEKHFVEKAAKPADDVEQADPLVTASTDLKKAAAKTSSKVTRPADFGSDDQLLEFEKLLAEKKALAAQKKIATKAEVQNTADEFADSFLAQGSVAEDVSVEFEEDQRSKNSGSESTVDSFDSLLSAADSDRNKEAGASKARARTVKPAAAQDVEVANQESLFGPPPRSRSSREDASARSESASQSAGSDGFAWPDPKTGTRTARNAAAQAITKSDEDQFASMFSESRHQDTPPAAALPANPESGVWSSGSNPRPAGTLRRGKMSTVRPVSAGRTLSDDGPVAAASPLSPVSPALTESTSELQIVEVDRLAQNQNESAAASVTDRSAMGSGLTIRMLVLLVGGIIVVALLFAPARKKPIHANQMPVQG